MEENDLVSIIVPVYNVEKYVNKCIDSILEQSYENIEIIIVDDGSTDESGKICDLYKDTRIKVFHKENGGLSDARNYGIKRATGKFITFIDSDDYVEKDYVKILLETLIKNNSDISICSLSEIKENENVTKVVHKMQKMNLSPKETIKNMLYHKDIYPSAWAKLYKKELFNNIEFPKGKIFEDILTTYKLILKSSKISCNLISLYNYVRRENSITTSNNLYNYCLEVKTSDEMGDEVLKIYPELERAVIRFKVYARVHTLEKIINLENRDYEIEKEYRKYIIKNSKDCIFDSNVFLRTKLAICCIAIGNNFFNFSRFVYSKILSKLLYKNKKITN